MNWAARRRLQYLGGLFGVCLIILFIFLYPVIFKKPTCTDGKQNGSETGVDCGGACSLMCKKDVADPFVLWSRAFKVVGNNYNLVAYVENQNKDAAIRQVSYEFRAYDDSNRLIGRRQGVTYIPPSKRFPIFEPRFESGLAQVKSVTFEFTSPFIWEKKDSTIDSLPIYIDNIKMGNDKESPSLEARMRNESVNNLPAFDAFVILYDSEGNAINASKTYRNGLSSGQTLPLFFTWPEPLTGEPVTEDVIFLVNPFTVSF